MDLKVIIRGLWDRIGGWVLIGLGALSLLLGWIGVSGTVLTSEQIPYVVSGGLVGIALIGVGATLLISADLRDEWRKLDDIEATLRRLDAVAPPSTAVDDTSNGSAAGASAPPRRRRRTPVEAEGVPSE